MLKNQSDLIIVDPKFDSPSRWAREHKIAVIHPVENRSKSDFVSEVNEHLSQCLNLIQQRQAILYDNPRHNFNHLTIVMDEVLAQMCIRDRWRSTICCLKSSVKWRRIFLDISVLLFSLV